MDTILVWKTTASLHAHRVYSIGRHSTETGHYAFTGAVHSKRGIQSEVRTQWKLTKFTENTSRLLFRGLVRNSEIRANRRIQGCAQSTWMYLHKRRTPNVAYTLMVPLIF
jgi:hypothetical protein